MEVFLGLGHEHGEWKCYMGIQCGNEAAGVGLELGFE